MARISNLYRPVQEAEDQGYHTIILQGGRRSTKSFTLLQRFIDKSYTQRNQLRVVVGADLPHMRRGIHADMLRLTNAYDDNKKYLKDYNKSTLTFSYSSGSQIIFTSLDNEEDAKMTDLDDFYLSEANSIKNGFAIYNQMRMQCKGVGYIDYNPIVNFWVHNKLIGRPGVKLLITDHRDNTFLTAGQHEAIETQYQHGSELWKVYARGLTGKMEGTIYANWTKANEWIPCEEVIWGIDYGYTVGMTAIVKVGILGRRKLQIQLCCYKPAITSEAIKQILFLNGFNDNHSFYSEHDPDKICELRRLDVNVLMAQKGDQSEWNGILKCKEFDCSYIYNDELQTELNSYQWETVTSLNTGEEVLTNKVKNTKEFHAMAAFRYAVHSHFFGR